MLFVCYQCLCVISVCDECCLCVISVCVLSVFVTNVVCVLSVFVTNVVCAHQAGFLELLQVDDLDLNPCSSGVELLVGPQLVGV